MSLEALEDYIDRYGIDVDELAVALLQRFDHLDEVRKEDFRRAVGMAPERSVVADKMLDLVDEAQDQLRTAKQLRESLIDKQGNLAGSVGDVTKTLMAADKILESAAKRFQTLHNISTQTAIEDAVKETMAELDEGAYQQFMYLLEQKLSRIR